MLRNKNKEKKNTFYLTHGTSRARAQSGRKVIIESGRRVLTHVAYEHIIAIV